MDVLLQFLAELLLQAIFEAATELGFRSFKFSFRQRHPALSALGMLLSGSVAGLTSLWPFPHSFIENPTYRLINLIATPVMAGLLMSQAGKLRAKYDQSLIAIDHFSYAFVFAIAMALIRMIFAMN